MEKEERNSMITGYASLGATSMEIKRLLEFNYGIMLRYLN